ncbi:MAG: tripartite tricarboxylate transporter TctB family protein [Thermodesulfobacteriota bacterium]
MPDGKGLNRDVILGLGLLAFSLLILLWLIPSGVEVQQAGGMAVTPTFFPYGVTAVLAVLSLALVVKGFAAPSSAESAGEKKFSLAVVIIILLLLASFYGLEYLGMVPTGILAVILLVRLFNYRNWPRTIIFAVVFVLLLFFFFEQVAQVDIPRGVWFDDLY